MSEFDARLADALREEIEEIAMNVDMHRGAAELDSRLDRADRGRRRTIWIGVAAAAAAVALLAFGVRSMAQTPAPAPPASQPTALPSADFTSSAFGLPMSADLPSWVLAGGPTSERAGWATWNRCPDNATECIGLSFNRYAAVPSADSGRARVSYTSYVSYLQELARAGSIRISDRSTGTVGGRPATLLSITPVAEVPNGVGCHSDGSCDDFLAGVPGRYAVVDTGGVDPDGEVLVLWTRAGAVAAPEKAWLAEYARTLSSVRFSTPSAASTP